MNNDKHITRSQAAWEINLYLAKWERLFSLTIFEGISSLHVHPFPKHESEIQMFGSHCSKTYLLVHWFYKLWYNSIYFYIFHLKQLWYKLKNIIYLHSVQFKCNMIIICIITNLNVDSHSTMRPIGLYSKIRWGWGC